MRIPLLDKEVQMPPLPPLPGPLRSGRRPSPTAEWLALGRALELHRAPDERIVADHFAPAFLSAVSRAAVGTLRVAWPAVQGLQRQVAAGLSTYLLCRHRHIDEQFTAALQDGVEQVLILGAGYDSRAYRFEPELRGRPVHEVDLPPVSRRKAAQVAAQPELFGRTRIRRVELDLRSDDLAERLLAAGFSVGARTFVICEGLTPYLSRTVVGAMLQVLRDVCGPDSVLAADLWDGAGGADRLAPLRRVAARAERLIADETRFGLRPDVAGDYLDAFGLSLVELLPAAELARRYATDGRSSADPLYMVTARF